MENLDNISDRVDLMSYLDDAQKQAVSYCDGPSLVIAGAGSGKTRVLTYKIAYLLEQGLPPYYILALTFTNKASNEMKSRIAQLVGEKSAKQLWMGTFHAVFSRILRKESELLGFNSNFTIFDTSDSRNLIKLVIKELKLDDKVYRPNSVHSHISRAKNSLITPAMYADNAELLEYDRRIRQPMIHEIYKMYQNRLRNSNSMDFDDLLLYTNILFRDNKDILEKYRNRFQYILVDEYQDTNFAQNNIVVQLAKAHNRVCVVGDDAQSIYSFRGANIDNILKFKSNFPDTRIFKLEQNYRSTQNIVNVANSLIKNNKEQIDKDVYSKNETGEKVDVVSTFSDFEEGLVVANRISRTRMETHASYNDFAILYRTNAQSRIFEEQLRKKNIPYRIYGGHSFYQRKEIKDVLSYFRLVVNPSDEDAIRRSINFPKRGIGDTSVAKISATASDHNVSMWQVIANPSEYDLDVNSGILKKLQGFYDLIDGFITQSQQINAFELATKIIRETGIYSEAYTDMTPEGMSRSENIQELLNAINEFVSMKQEAGDEDVYLVDFLSEVSLLTDQDNGDEQEADRVTLMTIHSAKGLEFDHIFIVGLEEDLFPSSMTKNDIRGLEEERRLFYVAITRARKTCTITYARSRFRNGFTEPALPSRFLRELDERYVSGDLPFDGRSGTRKQNVDGFWESIRNQRVDRERIVSQTKSQPSGKTSSDRGRFVPLKDVSSNVKLSDEAETLSEGDVIEHERFGRGVVTSIDMNGNNRRAFVDFEEAGKKQLLLKFAKFKIVGK
ncbi:MAG: ATP-dependent helicase [Fermentimonas sp.]|jgi:DNA helicase-2/ATP-dependent DNA helicase PcrA